MKKLMFYCQHILGMGHLVRSMEIVRGLTETFEVCFINGGEAIAGLVIPPQVNLLQLPPLKTDSEFTELQLPEGFTSLDSLFSARAAAMLGEFERNRPDVLMVELFPFGRRRFSAELIPLLTRARQAGTQIVCSLRDIVVTKQDQTRHEAKVCKLMNEYFDLLLVHGDPQFIPLEHSFARVADLKCPVLYTGYVAQEMMAPDPAVTPLPLRAQPYLVASVGGGRFGHDLLRCVAQASVVLGDRIPHHIYLFTGPFAPDALLAELQAIAATQSNLTVERYTPDLVGYLYGADLSINMGGYNTTLNVLKTGVRSLLLPFTGNDDQEQTIRAKRLEALGVVSVLQPADLQPERFCDRVMAALQTQPSPIQFDFEGVAKTAAALRNLTEARLSA